MAKKIVKLDRKTAQTIKAVTLPEFFSILRKVEATETGTFAAKWSGDSTWSGGMTYSEAVNAAELGWDNAPEIKNITLPCVQALIPETNYFPDVTGEILDFGAYFAGTPECWLQREDIEVTGNKVLRLSVEIGGSCAIEAAWLRNRGEAIIALINSLELAGYSIELLIVSASITKESFRYVHLIPAKQAGEALDTRRIQFMFTPAFYRRCIFAIEENFLGRSLYSGNWSDNYHPEGYIHLRYTDGLCMTLDESIKWAEAFASAVVDVAA